MTANALQLPYIRRFPALEEQVSPLPQRGNIICFEGTHLPEVTGECCWEESRQTWPHAPAFLLVMAAVSVACGIGERLVGNTLLVCFGLIVDPCILPVVMQSAVTLIGIGVASLLSKATPGSAAGRHMFLALLAAMGIGLIVAWLSHVCGCEAVLDWPLVLIYLLWAWAATVSAA